MDRGARAFPKEQVVVQYQRDVFQINHIGVIRQAVLCRLWLLLWPGHDGARKAAMVSQYDFTTQSTCVHVTVVP